TYHTPVVESTTRSSMAELNLSHLQLSDKVDECLDDSAPDTQLDGLLSLSTNEFWYNFSQFNFPRMFCAVVFRNIFIFEYETCTVSNRWRTWWRVAVIITLILVAALHVPNRARSA